MAFVIPWRLTFHSGKSHSSFPWNIETVSDKGKQMKIRWEMSEYWAGCITLLVSCIYRAHFDKELECGRCFCGGKRGVVIIGYQLKDTSTVPLNAVPLPFLTICHHPRPTSPLPVSCSCPIFHSLSGRAASEEPLQLRPTSAETSGPSCFKSECVLLPPLAAGVHGGVVPLCGMRSWGFTYAGVFEGLRGSKVFSINSRPPCSRGSSGFNSQLWKQTNPYR